VAGTPAYLPPEFEDVEGCPEPEAAKGDVWALGLTWLALVSGKQVAGRSVEGWVVPEMAGRETLMWMLEACPAKRASIDEVLASEAIGNAAPLLDLPPLESLCLRGGDTVDIPVKAYEVGAAREVLARRREDLQVKGKRCMPCERRPMEGACW
jgi:hypothetical protein